VSAELSVRRASVADVDRFAALFALYREFYGQAADVDAAAGFLRERLERGESVVFVAHAQDGAALGFVQVYPTFASVELGRAWRLNDLYVVESARGAGVGQALMRAAADAAVAAGAVWIDLETARDNAVAQRLYEREGYARDDVYLHYVKEL
jgi:ribosomal protein S18 acetylase RimI-like enzyme